MAIELIKSPLGHKISPAVLDAVIIDDGSGNALVYTQTSHLLSDGDYVYIQSNFDAYNGYKYVDSSAYDAFKIKESENGDYIQFVQDADIQYQVSILNHGFQCVHLPIVYELESDIYPNNSAEETYTPNTVVSQADSSGYTQINLIEALSDPTVYSKIELVGTGPLAGVYQILTVLQPWSVVIDLAYSASNSFSGYVIVKYYDNYAINVNVYAGLTSDHRWEDRKQIELAATLKFVPDDNGQVKFSIAELLRAYIQNRNNLTLDTLPNNLDFIVGFYISYYESYDESDGEDITTFEGDVTEDDFFGYALNAKLEFKSESVSHLSEYLDSGSTYARWLTLFESPIIMVGRFFDLSFINQYNGVDIIITKNGVEYLTISEPGIGIIRVTIEAESGEETICIKAFTGPSTEIVPADEFDLSEFQNDGTSAPNWVLGPNPSFSHSEMGALFIAFPVLNGNTITFHYQFFVSSFTSPVGMVFSLSNNNTGNAPNNTGTIPITGTGNYSGDISITTTGNRAFFCVYFDTPGIVVSGHLISIGYGDESTVIVPGFLITEEICLTVIEECDETFVADDVRLLEDGGFRLLE